MDKAAGQNSLSITAQEHRKKKKQKSGFNLKEVNLTLTCLG